MAGLRAYAYKGFGTWVHEQFHYTQAIRVGDRIICSGQGGWTPDKTPDRLSGSMFPSNIADKIDQAFANVEHNLKDAGSKGWSQVYKILTLSTSIPEQHEHIVRNLKKWMPEHRATWTEAGVSHFGNGGMHFEIEVEAYDPEGAKNA